MGKIRDTRKFYGTAEADMILADARSGGKRGSGVFIEEMEREGQAQLVTSDRLPARFNSGTQAEFEALGFTFGDPDPDDPMFRPATLPEGWKRKGASHAMWSYITDEHGRDRVSIFYKAAFYDRDAFMSLAALSGYVSSHVEYGEPLVITDEWATKDAVLAAMGELRERYLKEAADFRRYAADERGRDEDNRSRCAEIAAKKDATAAKYEAAAKALGEAKENA
jgi:hypothetical protein